MKGRHYLLAAVFILALSALAVTQPQAPAAGPYHSLKTITIGGDSTSWDYATVDEAGRRLYVTNGTKIHVIDIDKDEKVGEITDTPGVHGFAVAPELGLGFSSNGRENKASIVDLKTLQTKSKVDTGKNPDAILYVPGVQEVYTFNGNDNSATVFEAKTGKVIATIPLPGAPEFAVVDTKVGRVFNNIEDKSEVVAIDMKKHEVVATWPIAPGEAPSGMAIDLQTQRLFIGAGDNNMMIMMNYLTGKVVASVPIGAGVDANKFDPGMKLAFSSNGQAGNVTIAKEETPDKLTIVQTLATARGARTMALDPKTHKIYLAAVDYQPAPAIPPAGTPPGRGGRTPAVPGSFKVLVYGMDSK
jgi:YVTN family beta-propeller protein